MPSSPRLPQEARHAALLLTEYAFEMGWQTPVAQVSRWLEVYRPSWIRDAVVEALHQGRYKAISVQQILALWQRRGQPVRHFNKEFERTIAIPLGLQLTASLSVASASPGPHGQQPAASVAAEIPELISPWDEAEPLAPTAAPVTASSARAEDAGVNSEGQLTAIAAAKSARVSRRSGAIAPEQGILTSTQKPIQTFRPQLPFSGRPSRLS
ncbi:MAG: hypothetical protein AAFZ80_00255 [Cyanobacteria bacterium P01_A01_bin.105]